MSRGFVKEEDQEEAPFIPPRAALPAGQTNYVTERGMSLLEEEKATLEQQRSSNKQENETERRRTNMEIDGKIRLLNERLSSARIIAMSEQPKDEVRFGATVKYRINNREFTITIVGVDEADVKEGRVAFVAPLIKAMSGKKVGEELRFDMGGKQVPVKILAIDYQK
ncbi:GreA/GreB family elongation factor [Owenweeksia hongkongensis]|uniref:GreA/GreB family elongation factor n=1 Tax=Owenweeksia hongkongensis TaxID=253245 RepID=UPI003A93D73E